MATRERPAKIAKGNMNALRVKLSPLLVSFIAFVFAASCLSLASCDRSSSAQTDPQVEYNAAVQDARTMTAAKISKDLTAIVPYNANLIWENNVPGTRVLVATWVDNQAACQNYTNPTSPCCKAGQECSNYGFNSWVTVVPELKNLLGSSPTLLRVAQSLGLPPPSATKTLENTCIIEMYVSPANLFRPSADPEVTDHEAELVFPADGFRKFDDTLLVYSDMPCDPKYCTSCTSSGKCGMTSYPNWYNNRRAYIYSQTSVNSPYPWTALGYTYDWGNPTPPHFGVSEFVISTGTSGIGVFIKSCTWTGAYFNN
jgi:hypothetical protein